MYTPCHRSTIQPTNQLTNQMPMNHQTRPKPQASPHRTENQGGVKSRPYDQHSCNSLHLGVLLVVAAGFFRGSLGASVDLGLTCWHCTGTTRLSLSHRPGAPLAGPVRVRMPVGRWPGQMLRRTCVFTVSFDWSQQSVTSHPFSFTAGGVGWRLRREEMEGSGMNSLRSSGN
jgi:hypothetical protein